MDNNKNFIIDPSDVDNIPKFVDRLPIMPIAKPIKYPNYYYFQDSSSKNRYKITMKECCHRFYSNFPLTTAWGYDGMYPGPTIEAFKDIPTFVEWVNNLPDKHILPFDPTLHGTQDDPEVKFT